MLSLEHKKSIIQFTMEHIFTLFLYAPLLLALYIITKHFLRKLRNNPPAPFLTLPIIGHLYLLKKPLQRTLAKISNSHGSVLLLEFGSRKVLLVSSSSAAEECFTKNDIVFANRPRLMSGKILGYNFTSLVWCSYGDYWRNLRRITSVEMFSPHRLQMLHGIRVDEVKSMVKRINSFAMAEKCVDMKSVFFELMLNVMMRTIAIHNSDNCFLRDICFFGCFLDPLCGRLSSITLDLKTESSQKN